MKRLMEILSYRRCHGSVGEKAFVSNILAPYSPTELCTDKGTVLAYTIEVPYMDGDASSVLFSCHIDTVDRETQVVDNPVLYDDELSLMYKEDGTPLGADDGAGVWLMLEMIDAHVPGTYVFHRGEEKGGIGSSGLARDYAALLGTFTYAIAFDRRGRGSIITHQGMGRCCSDAFAESLSVVLHAQGLDMHADSTGVYTDTAEYTHLIPECTNLSCGYEREHSGLETLDVKFLFELRDAMVEGFDETQLVCKRDPDDDDYDLSSNWWANDFASKWDVREPMDEFDVAGMSFADLRRWVDTADPGVVADLLLDMADRLTMCEQSEHLTLERYN